VHALDSFKLTLNNKFECSDSGPAGYSLGVTIYRDRPARKLYLSQQHYLEAILDRFDLIDCNPARSPLPSGFSTNTSFGRKTPAARHRAYPQAVGAILYASTVTRPDLSQAAGVLSRFISKWNESRWTAAKHLLRYIRGTSDLCLTFTAESGDRIALGFADAAALHDRLCLQGLWRDGCLEEPTSANSCSFKGWT